MAKPTAEQMREYADRIRAAAAVICGDCAIAALALIQAQAKQEAHVVGDHIIDEASREAFDADVGRLKAAAIRGLEKTRAIKGADIKTNSAGGSC